jgi:metallophosphoesterase (TIGR00282 family)
LLFVGDIFGRTGRNAVRHWVPKLRAERRIDFVVGNGENAASGRGLTPKTAQDIFAGGVDVITLGNHTWDQKEVIPLLEDPRVLRPANYPPGLPGRGLGVYEVRGRRLAVLQLMGRHGMANIDCPFQTADRCLAGLEADAVLVDMHAEASSEKQAMGWHLDGRVAAVVGSHTHVQTADERLLAQGTAYLGDAGMTGPRDGVIGGDRAAAIRRFLTGVKGRLEPAEGDGQFCAALIDVDDATGRATAIERVQEIFREA